MIGQAQIQEDIRKLTSIWTQPIGPCIESIWTWVPKCISANMTYFVPLKAIKFLERMGWPNTQKPDITGMNLFVRI
jgi:hypothetical protein